MILSFCQWLQSTAFFTALRGSWYVYPTVMSLHLVGIAVFGGMVLMTNMRLLGLSMRKRSISDVVNQFRASKRFGFILIATCGILMFGSKAEEYYYNNFFRLKMLLLFLIFIHAWIFRPGIYASPAALDHIPGGTPGRAKLAAALSLVLWVAMACAGRGIGYVEAPLNKIHARLVQSGAVQLTSLEAKKTVIAVERKH
jgi:hypothetical protein